ncbi:retropepsin-like aspartic protease family protein [Croceicoccus gelatinilyticus]|uniref:retropepsin-like aspartic protease family protein n=1 Tax=Croceicoccus gelatinilyticus TaxID=2835536 RepID=UPI001BD03F25|nr:TIGR02281 family clan AA aspartic protease [Croceicoccus gelatinilyticus]MBS7669774.1 TIGR02281 family clan AA aspartic protease [Croceicoccus gelatinilyticus]
MKIGGILALGASMCALGAMMPDNFGGSPNPQDAEKAALSSQMQTSQPGASDYLSGEMVLQRQSDGHFYATPSINGVQVNSLVDTGASVIALTADDADAIGITWHPSELSVIGRGASGDVVGVAVHLDRVELGGFDVRDVDAVVIPEGLHITLLGQSFLSRIPNVAIADERMSLSDY